MNLQLISSCIGKFMDVKNNKTEGNYNTKLIELYEQRWRALEDQRARFGDLYTPPHILIEIEDIENKLRELKGQAKAPLSSSTTNREKFSKRFRNIGLNLIAAVFSIIVGVFANVIPSSFGYFPKTSFIWIILATVVVLTTVVTLLSLYYEKRDESKKRLIERIQNEQNIVSDSGNDTAQV